MIDHPPYLPGLGTPAELCGRCEGRGWVADAQWPSGRDVCQVCKGRRVISRIPAEIRQNPPESAEIRQQPREAA
jgi:hypothetical protein